MLSIIEVCQMTGKSEKTIYRMMNNGKLPYTQINGKRFVDRENILNLLPNKDEIEKKDNLELKISTLTNEIIRLSNLVETLVNNQESSKLINNASEDQVSPPPFKKQHKISSNEIRAQKAKNKLFEALDDLNHSGNIPFYRNAPSVTGIHNITGIDRGTISKYLQEWIDKNPIKNSP